MKTATILTAAALLAASAVPASAYTTAFTTAPLNMRSGPDVNYPPVAFVPDNAQLIVYGCLGGWRWCDVSWGDNRGWVAGAYLSAYYQGVPRPWYYAAPRYGVPIIGFFFGDYWNSHYRNRPWYRNRAHWSQYNHRSHNGPQYNRARSPNRGHAPHRGHPPDRGRQFHPGPRHSGPQHRGRNPHRGERHDKGGHHDKSGHHDGHRHDHREHRHR
jgi:uncharacterized protein YraI